MAYRKSFYSSLSANSEKRKGFENYYIPEIKNIFCE